MALSVHSLFTRQALYKSSLDRNAKTAMTLSLVCLALFGPKREVVVARSPLSGGLLNLVDDEDDDDKEGDIDVESVSVVVLPSITSVPDDC